MGKNNRQRRKLKKSKKSKKKKASLVSHSKKQRNYDLKLREIDNSTYDLTDDQMIEIAKTSNEKVNELITSLELKIQEYDPLILLSIVSGYGLTRFIDNAGVPKSIDSIQVGQPYVEFMQALILHVPKEQIGSKAPTADIVYETLNLLKDLSQFLHFSRLDIYRSDMTEQQIVICQLQEIMRSNTQAIRNWGYFSQVKKISKELYAVFDDELSKSVGITATNVIDLFIMIFEISSNLLNHRIVNLAKLRKEKNSRKLFYKYLEFIGQDDDKEDKANQFSIQDASIENVFGSIMEHYDLFIIDCFQIDAEYISSELELKLDLVNSALNQFSLSYGDLQSQMKKNLF